MKNICLLFGGKSFESEVSIISAFSAYHTIFDIYKIYMIYIKNGKNYFCKNLQKIIKMQKNEKITLPEVFFAGGKMFYKSNLKRPVSVYCALNCCHGGSGEDGGVAGMLDVAEIPYTSAGIAFSALFMDKELSKMVLTEQGFPVLPYTLVVSMVITVPLSAMAVPHISIRIRKSDTSLFIYFPPCLSKVGRRKGFPFYPIPCYG